MATFNEVFQRTEKKYRLTCQQRAALASLLETRMEPDRYGQTTITSLYLDTPDNDLICRSLEKPLYKEKIRIRRYGAIDTMTGSNEVFLEIKKKYKGVVYKRRIALTWNAAKEFLAGRDYEESCRLFPLANPERAKESLSFRSVQISREIEAFAQIHSNLEPSMSVAYDRTALCLRQAPATIPLSMAGAGQTQESFSAFSLAGQGNLRITFDDNIRYCDFRSLEGGPCVEHLLLPQGESLMEIKLVGAMPLWLSRALSQCDIRPASFSKYGESYKSICA